MKNLHYILRALVSTSFFALAVAATPANALTLDTKIGEANLANSGDVAELGALAMILGIPGSELTLDLKIDTAINATADTIAGQWFIDVAPKEPGYFLIKFGTGGTGATADTFFFENIGELSKLVFSDAQVQNLSGGNCGANNQNSCNIGKLSHYSTFNNTTNPPPTVTVPEPASLLLLGAGLLGLGFAQRRKPKHN